MAWSEAHWPSRLSDGWAVIRGADRLALPQKFQTSPLSTGQWLEARRDWTLCPEEPVWPTRFEKGERGMSCEQQAETEQAKPGQVLPNIDNGLGKSIVKQDLVALEDFLCTQEVWGVFEKRLCLYRAPCWRWLDDHGAEVAIRSVLCKFGYDNYLTSGEYRELRRMLLLRPELQMEKRRAAPVGVVNLLDCTLDIQTGELRAHDPEDGFFYYMGMTSTQIMTASSGSTFENFVANISGGDPDVRRQLLELVALLIANHPVKAFFVMLGPSNTGKTQFGRFLTELLGHENVETLRGIEDFSDKWTMGALREKRMVTCLDLPDYPLSAKAVGAIKQLVGDDAVKGEYKRGALFTFYEKPILVCAGNHPIRVPNAEREEALVNRLVIIPFRNPVPETAAEQELYKKLLEEAPYIVSQALDAWADLRSRNFALTHAKVPGEYQTVEGNGRLIAVQAFAEICLELEADAEIATTTVKQAFDASPMAVEMTGTDFARLLAQVTQGMGACVVPIKRVAGTDQRGYRGLKLREPSA